MKIKYKKFQQLLNDVLSNDNINSFNKKLCMALLSANTSLNILKNKLFNNV